MVPFLGSAEEAVVPFPAVLLVGGSGTTFIDISTGGATHSISRAGDTTWSSAEQYAGQDTIYFDGTGDYLYIADSDDWQLTGDYTIDFDFRYAGALPVGSDYVFSQGDNDSNRHICLVNNANGLLYLLTSGGVTIAVLSYASITGSTWYHVAIVRKGSTFTLYIDGVSRDTDSDATAFPNYGSVFRIGQAYQAHNCPFLGNMANFRITKGFARW